MTRLGDLLSFGQLLKPLATINLPKSTTFLGIFCKGVKINHFSSEIIFGQLLKTFGDFLLVTLLGTDAAAASNEGSNMISPNFPTTCIVYYVINK